MTHKKLVKIAYNWLLKIGCPFALAELKTAAYEQPDVIGWKNGESILIECKISRRDFLVDFKKRFRRYSDMGVGVYRFFMCPPDIINESDIKNSDNRWGLLWVISDKKIERIRAPKGNIWNDWPTFQRDEHAENLMLCSALRRVHANGDLKKILKI